MTKHTARLGFDVLVLVVGSFGAAMFYSLLWYEEQTFYFWAWDFTFGIIAGVKLPLKWAISAVVIYVFSIWVTLLDILPLPVYH